MGNKISCTCCIAKPRNQKVSKVVKIDGKVLTFTSRILVRDVLTRVGGVGLSREPNSENLPLDYKLKIGKVYYELPCVSSSGSLGRISDVKRVKIVITKRQLQELVARQISVEEVLLGLDKRNFTTTVSLDRSSENRRSNLESIPEEIE